MEKTEFRRFQLNPSLIQIIEEMHFMKPTEIQERIIPIVLKGNSVIGQSQTGTGKTLAYLLPLIERIDPAKKVCQAVITVPTRELAEQIFRVMMGLLPSGISINVQKITGGTDRKRMIAKLHTTPQVIIGTPGRIADLVKNGEINLFTASTLIVDEADQMLDMGFIHDVDMIAARMSEQLQMLVFSATIPERLQPFLKKYMQNPKFVRIKPQQASVAEIEHFLIPSRHRDLITLIVEISKTIHPYLALIFANTKSKADELYHAMLEKGFQVECLHGGLAPRERKQTIKRIERLECQYIVATDLAARGIDIEGVSHVINSELPADLDFYIHRTGRTGRAGQNGQAITVYKQKDEVEIEKLVKRGISFRYVDIKHNEWVDIKKRTKKPSHVSSSPVFTAKPKKVKPAYKKKFREKQAKLKKKQK